MVHATLKEGDTFVLGRGCRDVCILEEKKFQLLMPALKGRGVE